MTAILHNSFYTSCRDHAWQRELFPLKKSTVVGFSFLSGLLFNCFYFDFSSQKWWRKLKYQKMMTLIAFKICEFLVNMQVIYILVVFCFLSQSCLLSPTPQKNIEKRRLKLPNIPVRQVNLFIEDYFRFYWDTGTSRVKHCGFLSACSHTTQEVRGQKMKTILSNLILRRKEIGGM